MMPRMKGFVEEFIHMHGTVKEILPCVNDEPFRIERKGIRTRLVHTQEREREKATYIANKN